jgi:hypothetical protein
MKYRGKEYIEIDNCSARQESIYNTYVHNKEAEEKEEE